MKKYITLLLLLLSCTVSMAQIAVGIRLNNPLVYGSSISPLYNEDGKKFNTYGNWGVFNSGVFARIPLKEKHWVLHTDLLYKNEGTHIRSLDIPSRDRGPYYGEVAPEGRRHFSFEYIDAPCLLQWEGKRMFRGYLQAGFSLKFLTHASYTNETYNTPDENVTQHFNRFVLTGQAGGGVLWDIKRVIITTDMRMSWNLTPITGHKVRGVDFSDSTGFSLTLVSVGVGYKLGYKKNN